MPVISSTMDHVQLVPDSGATNHMVNDIDLLTLGAYPVTGDVCVQGIDGNPMRVIAVGSMEAQNHFGHKLVLSIVFFVPDKHVNVVSVSKLVDAGLNVCFSNQKFKVESSASETLCESPVHRIFTIVHVKNVQYFRRQLAQTALCFTTTLRDTWHIRLGHPSQQVLQHMLNPSCVTDLKSGTSDESKCLPCLNAKQQRVSHPRSTSAALKPLHLIHTDLTGPWPRLYGGSHYFLAALDDFGKYSDVQCLENKTLQKL